MAKHLLPPSGSVSGGRYKKIRPRDKTGTKSFVIHVDASYAQSTDALPMSMLVAASAEGNTSRHDAARAATPVFMAHTPLSKGWRTLGAAMSDV